MTIPGFEGLIKEFELEAQERLSHIESLLLAAAKADKDERTELRESIRKDMHTLKGNSAMMGLSELQQIAHELEDDVVAAPDGSVDTTLLLQGLDRFRAAMASVTGKTADAGADAQTSPLDADQNRDVTPGSVRVSFAALDELMQHVADMVILRNRVAETLHRGRRLDALSDDFVSRTREAWNDLNLAQDALARTLDVIQDRVVRLRMVPLKTLFQSLQRIVHDEAKKHGKEVELQSDGGDTPLDKALLELASDALGHLVRNSVVHGIEMPNEREAAGKPPQGIVQVVARTRGNEVRIEVADDGAGIDATSILDSATNRGIDTNEHRDPFSVLFIPGFSTKPGADISAGRGVGLSAVLEAVQRQGGQISVSSELGRGTVFSLDLPLSVSITRALLLVVDGEEYALPLMHIVETSRIRPSDRHMVNDANVMRWRGHLVPLLDLGHNFGTARVAREVGFVVFVHAAGKLRGLVVDSVNGIQEVVVNALGPILGHPTGIAGSTVLGDGRAVLILDARALIDVEPFVGEPA